VVATFEEKTYESYFNSELDRLTSIYFPLGQVQEGFLGFDSSAFATNRRLWHWLGYPFWFFPSFSGVHLVEIARHLERDLEELIQAMPPMKANLLFQFKRPEYISRSSGTEWHHWEAPYFRYNIDQNQQGLLSRIDDTFSSRLLILYAAPTVSTIAELVSKKLQRLIIPHSNFRRSRELNGHDRNTFIKEGTYSIACSEPRRLENFDLLSALDVFGTDSNIAGQPEDNRQFIINFQTGVSAVLSEDPNYGIPYRQLNESLPKVDSYQLLYSFLVMANFRQITSLQWLIKI
jgi:hypothetical protein